MITYTKRDGTVSLLSTGRTSPRKLSSSYVTLTQYRIQLQRGLIPTAASRRSINDRVRSSAGPRCFARLLSHALVDQRERTDILEADGSSSSALLSFCTVGFTYMLIACFPRDWLIASVRVRTHKRTGWDSTWRFAPETGYNRDHDDDYECEYDDDDDDDDDEDHEDTARPPLGQAATRLSTSADNLALLGRESQIQRRMGDRGWIERGTRRIETIASVREGEREEHAPEEHNSSAVGCELLD